MNRWGYKLFRNSTCFILFMVDCMMWAQPIPLNLQHRACGLVLIQILTWGVKLFQHYLRLSAGLCSVFFPARWKPRTRKQPHHSSWRTGCREWRFSVWMRGIVVKMCLFHHFIHHNRVTHPNEIRPPVCFERPLFTQLMEGRGWPDTSHSSTAWAPTGTVNNVGQSFTDGGSAKKRKNCHNQEFPSHQRWFGFISYPTPLKSLF